MDALVELAAQWVGISILILLACTAIIVVRMRGLWAAVMLTGIYSFLGASWMVILDAPDVAFTEAAVGAGISTVLMLGTLSLTGVSMKRREKSSIFPLIVVGLTGAALVYGTFDMPLCGDVNAPIHQRLMPEFMADTVPRTHDTRIDSHTAHDADSHQQHGVDVDNVVTAILASYRGYDTLGETTVIFTAGIGVMLLLSSRSKANKVDRQTNGMSNSQQTVPTVGAGQGDTLSQNSEKFTATLPPMYQLAILRVVTKLLIPYILLFALYVQFHGDYSPGGGFQAGVIFAAAFILYGLVFDLPAARHAAPARVIEILIASGVLLFAGTGVASMLLGGNFLDYNVLEHHVGEGILPHGQHLGILLVELGVGITVTAAMITIFFAFAGRGRVR